MILVNPHIQQQVYWWVTKHRTSSRYITEESAGLELQLVSLLLLALSYSQHFPPVFVHRRALGDSTQVWYGQVWSNQEWSDKGWSNRHDPKTSDLMRHEQTVVRGIQPDCGQWWKYFTKKSIVQVTGPADRSGFNHPGVFEFSLILVKLLCRPISTLPS